MKNKITIIIPTLNASKTIRSTLRSVSKDFTNIIIVDANSEDNTIQIAKKYKVKIIKSTANRGKQLHLGALSSNTDWILFLHADTKLSKNSFEEIKNFIKIKPNKVGYFKLKFNTQNSFAAILERIVYFRNIIFKLPYGDQGLLISKSLYNKIGGFKPLPIMEDVNIIKRIAAKNLILINSHVITDASKYIKNGWMKKSILNFICLSLYFIGYDINKIHKIYNYEKKN